MFGYTRSPWAQMGGMPGSLAGASQPGWSKELSPQSPYDPESDNGAGALARLKEIEGYWQQDPGTAPGGQTGVQDYADYQDTMQAQQEHQNLQNYLGGKEPMRARQSGASPTIPSISNDPDSTYNTLGPGGTSNPSNAALSALKNQSSLRNTPYGS